MSKKHKMILELIKEGKSIGSIDTGRYTDDFSFTAEQSIDKFPLITFNSTNKEINSFFMNFSKNDLLRAMVSHDDDNDYISTFEGDFFSKQMKVDNKHNTFELNVGAIHSFYKLSMFHISSPLEFKEVMFKDVVHRLAKLANIKSNIKIEEELGEKTVNGISRETNLFRVLKEICILKNAVIIFNIDNSVEIEDRVLKYEKVMGAKAIMLDSEKIISFKTTEDI